MQIPLEDFRRFLSRRGLKLTRDRREILRAIRATEDHFTIDDLFLRMRLAGSKIAKTTIYRAVPLLIDCDIIQKVPSNTKSDFYEQTPRRHHDHLTCLRCGRMVEVRSDAFEEAQSEVCRRHDFEPVFHRVNIVGYCRVCKGKQGRKATDRAPRSKSRARRSATGDG